MAQKPVQIADLVVADFRTEHTTPAVLQWRVSNHVPFAESCARQVWFGRKETFETFPHHLITGSAYTLHHGANAYRYLLALNLGLLSRKKGETNVSGQFYKGWENLHNETPELARQYDTLIQHVTADSRLIRAHILSGMSVARHELAARDLSGLLKSDAVLIIGAPGKDGEISMMTDGIARVTTSNDNRSAREIAITHPSPETAGNLYAGLKRLKDQGKVQGDVNIVEFSDLALAFELYDRVYITMPMGEDPDADAQIIQAWQGRNTEENRLVHMKAAVENMALSSCTWTQAHLENYVSPEEVRAEVKRRLDKNDVLFMKAEQAVELCIQLRLEGLQPSRANLSKVDPEIFEPAVA